MRLIDADALKTDFDAIMSELSDCITGEMRYGMRIAIHYATYEAPTIEPVPVRLGKWVKARGSWITPGGDPVWECSECGKGRHVYGVEHCSYGACVSDGQWVSCPNCGADMRSEK